MSWFFDKKIGVDSEIELIPLEQEHAPMLFALIDADREYLRKWLPFVDVIQSVESMSKYVNTLVEQRIIHENSATYCVAYQNELVGAVTLKDIDWFNQRCEIGYWLVSKMQKRGVVTRSVEQLIEYAFDEMKMNRLVIKTGVENHPSERIAQKLGFVFEGVERDGEFHHTCFIDLKVYALLKKNWQ